MAKRPKTRPAKTRRALPRIEIDWAATRRTLNAAAWVFAGGAAGTAWVLGVPRLEAYAAAHRAAERVELRFVETPAWLPQELHEELVGLAGDYIGPDPLRRADLAAARAALAATGWFESVAQLRRVNTGLVEIRATFAQPFAAVRDPATDRDHLIDTSGRLLPPSYPEGGATGAIVVTGVRYPAPRVPGTAWPGEEIAAAIELLQWVLERPWHDQVRRIDMSRYAAEATIRLVTDRGCTITWGRRPGREHGGEVPAEQKIRYLDYHHQEYGHIDRGFLRELDITGDVVIGR